MSCFQDIRHGSGSVSGINAGLQLLLGLADDLSIEVFSPLGIFGLERRPEGTFAKQRG